MTDGPQRILSLLPAATEIIFALGAGKRIVGVSHQCDHPAAAKQLPQLTKPRVDADLPSGQLDAQVKALSQSHRSLFELDEGKIKSLSPDLIIAQVHCKVCAVGPEDIKAVAESLPDADVFTFQAQGLEDVFAETWRLAKTLDARDEAKALIWHEWNILKQVRGRVRDLAQRSAVVVDWVDPLMFAGHWVPELVAAAGGRYTQVEPRAPSRWAEWSELAESQAEAILVAPCGRRPDVTAKEWSKAAKDHDLSSLPAVENGRVFAADGNEYFSRPGPRLVYSAAILARIIHPEVPELPSALEGAVRQLKA